MKVLILEDREDDALLVLRYMSQAGFDLSWKLARNKAEFESCLHADLDVILADYSLPGFNALQALRLMKELGLNIPFIVVTGTASPEKALECIEAGAADYLFKDRLERLGVAVTRALQQRQINQERHRLQVAQAQFIQNVSHEFRTPLGLIMGHADLLTSRDKDFSLGPLSADQEQSLDVICRHSEQLNKLVDDILVLMELDQARLDGGYRELSSLGRLNLSNLLSQRVPDFKLPAQEQGLDLVSDIEDGVYIHSSLKLVSAMTDNLISNAIKFTPDGSIAVSLRSIGKTAVLSVKDTGIGMTEVALGHVFDRFCQANGDTTRTYGGTGLGLSVVKEVVASMGGQIDVESEPGVGSRFIIILPTETIDD